MQNIVGTDARAAILEDQEKAEIHLLQNRSFLFPLDGSYRGTFNELCREQSGRCQRCV